MQAALFEPTGDELPELALMHFTKARAFARSAEVFAARGWSELQAAHLERARGHEQEAECLAMLADFERRAGLRRHA